MAIASKDADLWWRFAVDGCEKLHADAVLDEAVAQREGELRSKIRRFLIAFELGLPGLPAGGRKQENVRLSDGYPNPLSPKREKQNKN